MKRKCERGECVNTQGREGREKGRGRKESVRGLYKMGTKREKGICIKKEL